MRDPARPRWTHLRPRGSPKPRSMDADAVRRRRAASLLLFVVGKAVRNYSGRAQRLTVGCGTECVIELGSKERAWPRMDRGSGEWNDRTEVIFDIVDVKFISGDRRWSAKRVTLEYLFGPRDNDQVRKQPVSIEGMACAVTRRHRRRRRRRVVTAIVVLFRVDRVGHDRLGRPAALGLRPIGSRRDRRHATGVGRE
jgi:hypothetical protein